jgi:hypothetical protein
MSARYGLIAFTKASKTSRNTTVADGFMPVTKPELSRSTARIG